MNALLQAFITGALVGVGVMGVIRIAVAVTVRRVSRPGPVTDAERDPYFHREYARPAMRSRHEQVGTAQDA